MCALNLNEPRTNSSNDLSSEELRLRFSTAAGAKRYIGALASLFVGATTSSVVTAQTDVTTDSLEPEQIANWLDRVKSGSLHFVLQAVGKPLTIQLQLFEQDPCVVCLRARLAAATAVSRIWLQCDPAVVAAVSVLALPVTAEGLAVDAAHAFVGVAARSGGWEVATLVGDRSVAWARAKSNQASVALRNSHADAVWEESEGIDGTGDVWVSEPLLAPNAVPAEDWWERYDALVEDPQRAAKLLHAHLSVLGVPVPWSLVDLKDAPETAFMVPGEAGVVAILIPCPNQVAVAVDLDLPKALLAQGLLHACVHLMLGHVRPGDAWGHWDTLESISNPRRQWDRDVQTRLESHFGRSVRRVTSLEECSPSEKGWLLLQDHIGRMVGQTRILHTSTQDYGVAAYQRQAAQRLVAQLEEYGGAMLCDGVGLGKTYVATTVIIHHSNQWRDQMSAIGKTVTEEPFRVTVLSPNSVVSTWQREAIAPLSAHGVPAALVRVISHSKFSRIMPSSDILKRDHDGISDLEHLLLSDLVVVDEAHNFRSVGARRTIVLRDILRLQPRLDVRRKVLLLTATPVNNGLEDLRQQLALMLGTPLFAVDRHLAPEKYRSKVLKEIEERVTKGTKVKGTGDLSALLIHGDAAAKFAFAPEFRDDVQFGVQVPRVGDYLKGEERRLAAQQSVVRTAIQSGQAIGQTRTRIAGELLDRIVVQRSRTLCKQIEREQGSAARLLFRPDSSAPEKLVYEDVYDDTCDVLARFLPLFEANDGGTDSSALSLKVHMWADVRDGIRDVGEVSSVVGLQRVLVLKRLESSPVSFLITLLRLLALHAHRLKMLLTLCRDIGDVVREQGLANEVTDLIDDVRPLERERIDTLLTGSVRSARAVQLLERWSEAHLGAKAAADTDDPLPTQVDLFSADDEEIKQRSEQLDRLWTLREPMVRDLSTLLQVAPGLADIVFGRFAQKDWPQRFLNGGMNVDWPKSAVWARRIVSDAKIKRLVARLLLARRNGQKVVVFSQFTDTLAYLNSVLRAVSVLRDEDWKLILPGLSVGSDHVVTKEELLDLIRRTAVVSGETEDRDAVINSFAPFYRLGPSCRRFAGASEVEQSQIDAEWIEGWTRALKQPVDVLLATDVLAEGVNLQDAALLVNFDVHWNPVRMIQRAGRIDRRLNPVIEEAKAFPDLDALAGELGLEAPRYWWHAHVDSAPATLNMLLPDQLESELQLRERIANKTLAIDFTMGLEQGTGAEADWMAEYRYQGISALNAWQGDRAIEQVAGYQHRLRRLMGQRGIRAEWLTAWNGWLREVGGLEGGRVFAWAQLGRKDGEATTYTRQLQPRVINGVPHWLWTTAKPGESLLNFWLVLDSTTFPAAIRTDLAFSDDASRPISAEDLLAVSRLIVDEQTPLEELGDMRRPLLQGAVAISAGFLGAEPDRRALAVSGFRILQVRALDHDARVSRSEDA